MRTPIALSEVEDARASIAWSGESTATRLKPAMCTLRFRLASTDADSLEALRYARRSMLREEWTRGIEEGEPSLEDAVFSVFEVVWSVPEHELARSRQKVSELVERANRALEELAGHRAS
jgi:hypothetical protein